MSLNVSLSSWVTLQTAIALVTGHKTSPQVFVRGLFVGGATECLHLLETGKKLLKSTLSTVTLYSKRTRALTFQNGLPAFPRDRAAATDGGVSGVCVCVCECVSVCVCVL